MKKSLLPVLGALLFLFSSCKKSYTCSCSTSYTFKNSNSSGYTNIIIPGDNTAYSEKMTEKKAKSACSHEQNAIQSDFTNGITGNGNSSLVTGESIVTTCAITSK